jgi:hypothetical protein
MISLRQHDRVGRSRAPDPASLLPSLEERAAIARGWAASTPMPGGTRRQIPRRPHPATQSSQLATAVAAVVDPVLETAGVEDCDVAGLRAFAERMLRTN